jgi:GntR family transcriptional repressor for pyruvate dehydrogenase complex
MSAPLTEAAIRQIREMIAAGDLVPGARLPPEAELATALGASRNTVREAVRGLVTAGVLDVRRGDGTFVTSLRPELLLEGIGAAAEQLFPWIHPAPMQYWQNP